MSLTSSVVVIIGCIARVPSILPIGCSVVISVRVASVRRVSVSRISVRRVVSVRVYSVVGVVSVRISVAVIIVRRTSSTWVVRIVVAVVIVRAVVVVIPIIRRVIIVIVPSKIGITIAIIRRVPSKGTPAIIIPTKVVVSIIGCVPSKSRSIAPVVRIAVNFDGSAVVSAAPIWVILVSSGIVVVIGVVIVGIVIFNIRKNSHILVLVLQGVKVVFVGRVGVAGCVLIGSFWTVLGSGSVNAIIVIVRTILIGSARNY